MLKHGSLLEQEKRKQIGFQEQKGKDKWQENAGLTASIVVGASAGAVFGPVGWVLGGALGVLRHLSKNK